MFKTLWEKIGEYNWKPEKTNPTTSQMCIPKLEHDQIQAWWISNILSKNNVLKIVWWCKCSNINFLKSNHLLYDELFKQKKKYMSWERKKITCHFEMSLKRESVIVNSC